MSSEPAGFNLPTGDFTPAPPAKRRGLPLWLMIVLGAIGLMVLGCLALFLIGSNPAVQQAAREQATAQAATSQAQLATDEELIVNGEQLLDEPFDTPDAISITPDDGSSAEIRDGFFEASMSESSQRSVFLDERIQAFASEVECVVAEGGGDGRCGIVFGVREVDGQDESDEHFFYVTGNGNYGFVTAQGGSDESFEKGHDAVADGEGAMNLLRVVRQGPDIRLYVNDVLVDHFERDSLLAGGVGFAAGGDEREAVVRIDNFRVWEIEE